jgi:hypothetical protein
LPTYWLNFTVSGQLTDTERATLQCYLQLKVEESETKERLKAIQPDVLELLSRTKEGNLGFGAFQFQSRIRRTYEYNAGIVDTAKALKEAKHCEEKNGTAREIKSTLFVAVTVLRNEEGDI